MNIARVDGLSTRHPGFGASQKSRNASLFEDVFPCKSKEEPSSSKRVLKTINENSPNKDGEVEPRCNKE